MWSKFMLGGGPPEEEEKQSMISPPASPPVTTHLQEEENDPLLLPPTDNTATPDQDGSLNARFGYVGRLAHRFLEQVAGDDDDSDDGWNEDDLDELGESSSNQLEESPSNNNNVSPSVSTGATSFGTAKSEDEEELQQQHESSEHNYHDSQAWNEAGEEEEVVEQQVPSSLRAETPSPSDKEVPDHHSPSGSFATARHEEDADGHSEYHDPSENQALLVVEENKEDDGQVVVIPVEHNVGEAVDQTDNASDAHDALLVVDMVPKKSPRPERNLNDGRDTAARREDQPSLIVQAELEDLTRDSGRTDDIEDDRIYDNEDELNFGPVVDVIPKPSPLARRLDSMAVQVGRGDEDEDLDNDEDEYDADGAGVDFDTGLQSPTDAINDQNGNDNVVDHLPEDHDEDDKKTANLSVGVLASLGDEDGDTFVNTRDDSFGPVVDVTPMEDEQKQNMQTPSDSLAVNAADVERDIAEEEEMDFATTTIQGSIMDETEGEMIVDQEEEVVSGWDEDTDMDDDTKDEKSDEGVVPKKHAEHKRTTFSEPLHVIDHLPPELQKRTKELGSKAPVDPSTAALAASEDISRDTGDGNDEEVYDDENELEYGPVVDHTPVHGPPFVPASQLGTDESLAVNAQALEEDIKEDEAMDDDDGSTDIASGYEGWSQENSNVFSAGTSTSRISQKVALVDQTPSEIGSPLPGKKKGVDRSVEVLASVATSRETGDADSTAGGRVVYGQVVDHTPATPASSLMIRSDSVIVQGVENASFHDDSTDVIAGGAGEGWDHGTDSLVDDGSKNDEQPLLRCSPHPDDQALVDHTPAEIDGAGEETDGTNDPSIIVLASEVNTRDSGEVDSTGELAVFGLVVDQTPETPADTISLKRSESIIVQCADDNTYDDDESTFDSVTADKDRKQKPKGNKVTLVDHTPSEMGSPLKANADFSVDVLASEVNTHESESEEVDSTGESAGYGPVVDQTPTTPATSLLARSDSVVAQGADDTSFHDDSTDIAGGGGDGYGQNHMSDSENETGRKTQSVAFDVRRDVTLVDHTPSDMDERAVQNGDPSLEVLPSETDTRETGDADSTGEQHVVYGPVVDQTPTTPATLSSLARSDSVMVQIHDDIDTIDETTIPCGISKEEGDTVNGDEMPADNRSAENEDQLVDHIPTASASRYGDASTLVAAEPSEVISEVDDMAPEEQNFGPVVDQTPRVSIVLEQEPSEAGSTGVFAPASLAADDLDEEVADGAEDQEVWNHDDHLEETPNPQSGNDEAVMHIRFGEQLVDFLPPPNEDAEEEDTNREVMSEMAVGGAQSLLPDAIDDDFGPVVDQIPASSSCLHSHESTSTQVTASECRSLENDDKILSRQNETGSVQTGNEIVVDQLPLSRGRTRQDSVATVTRSQISEDEEDASKFGPVVDQLPTSRASFAPSRGGSTVDALGTVSEVNSDDDGEGWDDDADFETSTAGVSDVRSSALCVNASLAASSSHDRNTSVRFDASAGEYQPRSFEKVDAGPTEKPSMESRIDEASIDDKQLLATVARSFAEAETPPSTPYRRGNLEMQAEKKDETVEISVPRLGAFSRCEPCCNANGVDCPCVRRLIDLNRKTGSMIGIMKDSDGNTIKVDFSQLLQDEMTRRRLLEEELSSLKILLASNSSSIKSPPVRESDIETEILDLKRSRDSLSLEILKSENKTAQLQEENESFQAELHACCRSLAELTDDRDELALLNTAIMSELQTLKDSLSKRILDSMEDNNRDKDASPLTELATKTGKGPLAKQIADLQTQQEEELQQNYKLLDKKADDIKNLEKAVALLQAEKKGLAEDLARQRSLAEQSESLANELIAVAKERDLLEDSLNENREALLELQLHFEHHGNEHQQLHSRKEQEMAALQEKVTELSKALESKEEELRVLKDQVDSLSKERDDLLRRIDDTEKVLLDVQNEVNGAHEAAENEKKKALEFQEMLSALEQKAGQWNDELDSLRTVVNQSEAKNEELKKELISFEEASNLLAERNKELENVNLNASKVCEDLEQELDDAKNTNKSLLAKCAEMENQYSKSLIDFESKAQQLSLEFEEDLAKIKLTNDKLREEVVRLQEAETHHAHALEEVERSAEEEMRQHEEITQKLKYECNNLRDDLSTYKEQNISLSQALRDLEDEKAKLNAECERLLQEVATESLTLLQQKLDEQSRDYESRMIRLTDECETLRKELERSREKESELRRNLESSQEGLLEQKSVLESHVESIKAECDDLRKQVEHHRSVNENLVAEEDRFGEIERECVMITEENEELLIQLALLKQQKDDLEQRASKLESEHKTMEQLWADTEPELEQLRKSQNDQLRLIEELTNKNSELEATIVSLPGKETAFKQKIVQQETELQLKNDEIESLRIELKKKEEDYTKIIDETSKESIELKKQLESTKEMLSVTEASLDSKKQVIELVKELELQVRELELQLEEKDSTIEKLNLKLSEREKEMHNASLSKAELEALQKQIESLSETLQWTRRRLASKEEYLDRLSLELRDIQSRQCEEAAKVAAEAISQHSKETKESIDLAKRVIDKAARLKRSESMRAKAMHRLNEEREINAENLRRLRNVVEKFYSAPPAG